MENATQKTVGPKLLSSMVHADPAYRALIQDVREIAGEQMLATGVALAGRESGGQSIVRGDLCWHLNKLVVDPYQRQQIGLRVASRAPAEARAPAADLAKATEFRDTGFLDMRHVVTPAQAVEMGEFLKSRSEFVTDGPVHNNTIEDIVAAPHALELATHPEVLSIVADHLGGAPTIVDLCAWWSDPTPQDDYGAHIFHRDKDDFRACKMFLYLTDVETTDGPHIFARRTHDPEFIKQTWTRMGQDSDPIEAFFTGNGRHIANAIPQIFEKDISEVTGPVGSCFLENTYGFHRGKTPKRNRRGIFQAVYGTTAYPVRLHRMAPIKFSKLPATCSDTPLVRHATRLLFDPQ